MSCTAQVYGLPTFVLFKNGEEMEGSKHEGVLTKPLMIDYLKKNKVIS